MSCYFDASVSPSKDIVDELSCTTPLTPFNSYGYFRASNALGKKPCVLALYSDKRIVTGCLALLPGNILSRRLQIVTVPNPRHPDVFWNGVREFCIHNGVWELEVLSFCSQKADIPALPNRLSHRHRCEFLVDLTCANPSSTFSKNHQRNIRRASKSGFVFKRTKEFDAVQDHLALNQASLNRRKSRGEDVTISAERGFFERMLEHDVGEVFQLMDQEKVLSSIVILKSIESAYYLSAGTSPEGMKLGASMFLVSQVVDLLKEEGFSIFNLGGAGPEEQGLQRFKRGFGATQVELETATFSMVSPLKRGFRTAVLPLAKMPLKIIRSRVFSGARGLTRTSGR